MKKISALFLISALIFSCTSQPATQTSATPSPSSSAVASPSPDSSTLGQIKELDSQQAWKDVISLSVMNNKLYTVEKDGFLYETITNPVSYKTIGEANFKDIVILFSASGSLYGVTAKGSLNKISVTDGKRYPVGNQGDLQQLVSGDVIGDKLYTVEKDGQLYETNLNDGSWKAIGEANHKNAKGIFASSTNLYEVLNDGNLYTVNTTTGQRSQLGNKADFAEVQVVAVINDKLYTLETGGKLYETNLADGKWVQIGSDNKYGNLANLFSTEAGRLMALNKSGNLVEILLK